ncbi:MPO1 2-hydroxy-palmitic acid dioxygenase MPO1 [Candida maltosa Xu316]
MAGLFDLEDHLVFYRSYHFNHTNVTIHLICIPIILLSTITFLSPVQIIGFTNPLVNLGNILAWSYGIYYVLLDWQVGLPSATLLTSYAYFLKQYYLTLDDADQTQLVKIAIGLHVFAWLAQFYGHGVHEKRAPALLDNLLGALVLAPFFVAFEIAFFFGLRTDLKKNMDNKAGVKIRDFIQERKKKKSL